MASEPAEPTTRQERPDCKVEGCSNMREIRGPICSKHRLRKAENGQFDRPWDTEVGRFWSKVDKSGECWVWTAKALCENGYGRFYVGKKPLRAHRYSWELANGPITDGLFVCHRCDNPPCVNPAHLFLGTHQDNMQDMVAKGRSRDRRKAYRDAA
jgi:hypothetical protein